MADNDKEKGGARGYSADGVVAQHDERVATQIARDAYSRERYEFLLRVIFAVIGLLAVSMALSIYLASRPEKFRYFATDPEGGIREVVPLERPIQSTGEVLNWATEAVTSAFTLSFANYEQQFGEIRLNFTEQGWDGYNEALKRQKLITTIIEQKLVTTAVPTGAPVVIGKGVGQDGRFGWRIQLPMVMTFESASGRSSEPRTIEAVVVRRPEYENPRGLGIAQIVTK